MVLQPTVTPPATLTLPDDDMDKAASNGWLMGLLCDDVLIAKVPALKWLVRVVTVAFLQRDPLLLEGFPDFVPPPFLTLEVETILVRFH